MKRPYNATGRLPLRQRQRQQHRLQRQQQQEKKLFLHNLYLFKPRRLPRLKRIKLFLRQLLRPRLQVSQQQQQQQQKGRCYYLCRLPCTRPLPPHLLRLPQPKEQPHHQQQQTSLKKYLVRNLKHYYRPQKRKSNFWIN